MRAVVLVLVVLVGTAGCAAPAIGPPAPTTPAGPQLEGMRPVDIPVAAIDPCSLLTEPQREELQVGRPFFEPPDGRIEQTCSWTRSPEEPIEGYNVGPSPGHPAALLESGRGAREIVVTGFPAVEVQSMYTSDGDACTVLVDVAPNEILQLLYSYNGTELQPTLEESCAKARRAAEMAMQTLIAQNGG